MKTVTLLLLLIVSLSAADKLGGVRSFSLLEDNPGIWYQDSLPWLLSLPNTQVEVWSSLNGDALSFRLNYRGIPITSTRTWTMTGVRNRLVGWGRWKEWTEANARNGIRNSGSRGQLVPTIYLPLSMPGILGDAIGTGGQLDISGHQTISLSGVSHIYPNRVNVEGESSSLFPDLKMEQQLRVRLDGTIGEKIHVAVDHDSQRQIGSDYSVSLSYDGEEEEIIQSIELGDVNLSITGPEFISYSIPHQGLFGAKLLAQAGPFDFTAIASKEGSSTESSDFVGQASLVTDSILDIHPANNYFFRPWPDSVAAPAIASIEVFIDDGDATNNLETGAIQGSCFVPTPSGDLVAEEKWWDILTPGIDGDYVLVDSGRTIRFLTPVNDTYDVAVALVTVNGDTVGTAPPGGPYNLKWIKQSNPLPSDPTWNYEMRNYYFLGANNIVRESFNCDIFLQRPGEEPISTQNGIPFTRILGLDTNGDGLMYDEEVTMDWENGFIIFPDTRPFMSDSLAYTNNFIYTERNPTASQSLYYMRVSYRAASTTYSLGHMGIVEGSERVTLKVSGVERTLIRDQDYSIIYEVGLLTLMGEAADLAQDPANTLRVTFEYVPFFSSVSKTLLGARMVYNAGAHSWIGGTMMYESASSSEKRPRVGEGEFGTTVFDVDMHFEARPEFMTDAVNLMPLISTEAESRVVLEGEVAMSLPAGENRAWVDDMEGSESAFPLGQSRESWFYPSMPRNGSENLFPVGDFRWYNVTDRWSLQDIIPGETGPEARRNLNSILQFVFTPSQENPSASWGGFQRCIERYGTDFSKKTHLSLYVRPTGCALDGNLYIDLGERIDEDTYWLQRVGDELVRRANGELDTEDVNSDGIRSSTEDTGLDTLMSQDEPGFSSSNPDPNQDDYYWNNTNTDLTTRYMYLNNCEGNGRLDTEDLNRNGILDRTNTFYRISIPLSNSPYIISTNPENGWMLIQIPLDDSSLVTVPELLCQGEPTWEKITYARIWVDGFTQQDTLEFYDIGLVGNRWQPDRVRLFDDIGIPVASGESFTVSVVNNRENSDYMNNPPPGIDPGNDENGNLKLEQSISLDCENIASGHQGVARQSFYTNESYILYRKISFPFKGTADGGEVFLQIGRDSLNYYEVTADITTSWQQVEVELQDLVDLKTLKDQSGFDELRDGNLAVVGNPSLAEILVLGLGVRNTDSGVFTGSVWVDDIVLDGHYLEPGNAHRLSADVDFADLLSVSGDYRMIDDDFHSLGKTSGSGNTVTNYSSSSTLSLDRFSPPVWNWSLPATLAWNRTITEPRYAVNSDIRLEGAETWDYRTESNRWDTSIQWRRNGRSDRFMGRYFLDPVHIRHAMARGWGRSVTTRDSLESETFSFDYSLSLGRMSLLRLPLLEDIRLRPTRFGFGMNWQRRVSTMYDIAGGDTVLTRNDTERSLSTDGSIAFNPWKGLTASYNLSVSRDMYYPWEEPETGFNIGREVSRSQSASLSQEINFWNVFRPRLSWDVSYSMARLSPHTSTGADTLSRPDVGADLTGRLNLRFGLAHTLRSIARLRDERLDEEAIPGSPRWFLMKMERWADRITDPTIAFTRSRGTDYKDVLYMPSMAYQFGFEPLMDGIDPYNRTESNSVQISGGYRPANTMSIRAEYNDSESKSFYSGFWNRTDNTTWPSITVSWSGLERFEPLAFLRSGSLSSGYRLETTATSRIESDSLVPVSETETTRWSPLVSFTGTLDNKVQITLSDNISKTETRNYTGTTATVHSGSNSAQFKLSYAFSAPGGFALPIPLLNRLRLAFQSDLTTALSIVRSTTKSEIHGGTTGDNQVQSDKTEWRIEPSASYDFGTVTASMTGIYGWKSDKVNNQYDQRDVGLNISVTINF
ncbi:hypothetical protein CSA37_02925 [Candidatus Fermentibacteria bacterium]|nr:MAG: hypothetical protein CSA37_02925 [Candidatus Fermentibacteria bacterium]